MFDCIQDTHVLFRHFDALRCASPDEFTAGFFVDSLSAANIGHGSNSPPRRVSFDSRTFLLRRNALARYLSADQVLIQSLE
jgi:tRNA(His) 5'-end guanylyltransferase